MKQMKMETQRTKTYGYSKSSSKREVYSCKCLYEEKRSQINLKELTLHLKELEKEQTKMPI